MLREGVFVFRSFMTIVAVLMCSALALRTASSATVFETTQLVATSAAADAQLPDTVSFDVTTAGTYAVTLRDLNTPSLLTQLRAIVTRDLQVVAEVRVTYPGGTPPLPDPAPATDTFSATPGTYRIHVLGVAGTDGVGSFGVGVEPQGGGTPLINAADSIVGDASPGPGQSVLQTTFAIANAGTYQFALTDHGLPAALQSVDVILLPQSGGAPVMFPPGTPFPASFTAATDTYELLIIATADATELAGLYSVQISGGPSPAVVYRSSNAVGNMPPATELSIATAGPYSLTVADAGFPAPLSSFSVAVVQGGLVLVSRSSAGSTDNIQTAQGPAQLFAFAKPADAVGVGAFTVRYAQGSQIAFADVRTADISPDPATPAIYSFVPSQPVTAGNYRLTVDDLRFLSPFVSLDAAVVQGDHVVDSIESEGELNVALQGARAKVIVAATPPANGGNALFGLNLTSQPAGAVVFESTQGVGGLFRSQTLQIATAGRYDITLADLEFPARLRTNALGLTHGTELVAQIFGSGTLPPQQLAAGTYVLNFLGQPAANEQYGAYGAKVADSAPVPTVTLTATPASITSGERTTLQWTSTNATSCTATNGWSGAKTASGTGTEQSAALTANATFDISCSGAGGSANASVSVTVNPPSANRGGGGGGSMDPLLLIYMCLALAACRRRPLSG